MTGFRPVRKGLLPCAIMASLGVIAIAVGFLAFSGGPSPRPSPRGELPSPSPSGEPPGPSPSGEPPGPSPTSGRAKLWTLPPALAGGYVQAVWYWYQECRNGATGVMPQAIARLDRGIADPGTTPEQRARWIQYRAINQRFVDQWSVQVCLKTIAPAQSP